MRTGVLVHCVAMMPAILASSIPERPGGADWRHFVAGGLAAALSHGYTTPIDVVKTRMQTNPELYNGSLPIALRKILRDEGALFLFSGEPKRPLSLLAAARAAHNHNIAKHDDELFSARRTPSHVMTRLRACRSRCADGCRRLGSHSGRLWSRGRVQVRVLRGNASFPH